MKKELFKEALKIPYNTIFSEIYDEKQKKLVKRDKPSLQYLGYDTGCSEYEDNYIFEGKLTFLDFSKGRSSVKANFVSHETGCKFEMFLFDFEKAFKTDKFINHLLEGYFCWRKQGSNYGVVLLEDYIG